MEPFKEFINESLISALGRIFLRVSPEFPEEAFTAFATQSLDKLELKQRVLQVRDALDATLPTNFDQRCTALVASLHPSEDTDRDQIKFSDEGASGFAVWPLTELVSHCGLAYPEQSLAVLKEMTKRFSAEFAVRPFLAEHEVLTLKMFQAWTADENRHVRRLVSEGSRPRLPWGMRLHKFVQNPAPVMPLLEALKDDPEEYVRRSVANNLNDIAKDHPETVVNTAEEWIRDASKPREKLLKHACRSLIKNGNSDALGIFGYSAVGSAIAKIQITTPVVQYGGSLEFSVSLTGLKPGGNLMIDYVVHFVKANGSTSPKVFKWVDKQAVKSPSLSAVRKHAIKPITTRKYYPGTHALEIKVNGVSLAMEEFELTMP